MKDKLILDLAGVDLCRKALEDFQSRVRQQREACCCRGKSDKDFLPSPMQLTGVEVGAVDFLLTLCGKLRDDVESFFLQPLADSSIAYLDQDRR